MEYICICGKKFDNYQRFNGHKAHCKNHQINKYGSLDKYFDHVERCKKARYEGNKQYINSLKVAKEYDLEKWVLEQHRCEKCGKIMTEYFGSGRFCSKTCANSRKHSEKTLLKISNSVSLIANQHSKELQDNYYNNPKCCVICNTVLPYKDRYKKTCSVECYSEYQKQLHKNIIPTKRSKNEIYFCNLCEQYFGIENVIHNEPIFNGWDADIILLNYKLAILWNGIWHYKKITANQKFEQIQNRDKIKLVEINNCGYTPYIIEDFGSYNLEKVYEEFEKLKVYLAG